MNRVKLIALAVVAVALSACSGVPTWNDGAFPNQPEYGMSNYSAGDAHTSISDDSRG